MPHFLKMDKGALEMFLIVPPYFMVFSHGFNSAWLVQRVQGDIVFWLCDFMVIAHLDMEGPLYCLVLMTKLKTRECGLQFGWRYKLSGYLVCLHVQTRPGVIYLFYAPMIPGLKSMMVGETCYSKVCGIFFSSESGNFSFWLGTEISQSSFSTPEISACS